MLVLALTAARGGLANHRELVVHDPAAMALPARGVRITYLGTNGYLLEARGCTLLLDPYFSRASIWRVVLGLPLESDRAVERALARLPRHIDAIVVTHGHFDHLLDVPAIMRVRRTTLIASHTSVLLAQAAGVERSHLRRVAPGETVQVGAATVRALTAAHDRIIGSKPPFPGTLSTVPNRPRAASDWKCGEPLAFLIEIGGRRIYVDSGGTPELLPRPTRVDLAILGVALPDSRARLVPALRRLRPHRVLPSHQDDFFRPLERGFTFGLLSDFPQVRRQFAAGRALGRLILLDYFRPWTLR